MVSVDDDRVPRRPRGARTQTWPFPSGEETSASPISWASLFEHGLEAFRAACLAEAGVGRLFPWVPVAFGSGVCVYFAVSHEPVVAVVMPVALALCLAAVLARRTRAFVALTLIAACASGFAAGTVRTARVAHGVLARTIYSANITGFVETHEERDRSDRFVLRVESIDARVVTTEPGQTLERVRLSVKKGTAPLVGSHVTVHARLLPPLAPLRPGGYDFSRDLYFQRIGASGFVQGAIHVTPSTQPLTFGLRYAAAMQGIRDVIEDRIRMAIQNGDSRAIASALLTGRQDAITQPVYDAMFVSGLGHVLSISGYHMAVVAGVVFFVIRALLALVPMFQGYPVKKWAAAVALVAAFGYLLLSGAEVATQRSFVMIAVVLIAVMFDRRAVTFRTLAIAALAVMLFLPEATVHPSFEMSFAATMALVALAQYGMPHLAVTSSHSFLGRIASWGGRELTTLILASLFAGFATEPYAAFHFHRVTPYGVLANLAAMPVVSAVVMPAGMAAIVAIPFGFDDVFWRIMDLGIVWMVAVTQWVAALPGALFRVPAFGSGALALASLGMIVLALLRTRLRLIGIALFAVTVVIAARTPQPDILIGPDGPDIAVRGADGALHMMKSQKTSFAEQEWLAADADGRKAGDPLLAQGSACDDEGCTLRKADGGYVAFGLQPSSIADDCERADVVVTRTTAPADCAAMVISLDELRDAGSIAMIQREGWLDVMEARPANVDRPWSRREAPRPVLNVTEPEDSAGESRARASESATPSRNAAAVDATPPSTEPGDDP